MRLAYFGFPHFGGTFTVYRLLRQGLAGVGLRLDWLGVGAAAHRALADPVWTAERAFGRPVGSADTDDAHAGALALANAVEEGGYDGILVGALTSRAEMSAVRYLRARCVRIMIVHNITPGTYAAARALRDHVHASVAISPRIRSDLLRRHGFAPERCVVIGHGTPLPAPQQTADRQGSDGPLRLIYLGRIEDTAKGVFWLPAILKRLAPAVTLTVAGDGPDLPALRRRCAPLGARVRFLGAVAPEQVPILLAHHDALLAPSRFEGFCLTLTEAMAAGCVPVASRIIGVTDDIIEHGENGFLFRIGDIDAAAWALMRLTVPERRRAMAAAARATVRARFTIEGMAERYLGLVATLQKAPPPLAPPLDPSVWELPRGLRAGLRSRLPTPLKNFLRTAQGRFAA
jgi:glycosyltransferase involved in cell wall biosynthesis